MRVIPFLLVTSIAGQCTENEIRKKDSGTDRDPFAEIQVEPELIDFGGLRASESAVQEVRITNRGTTDLRIDDIRLSSGVGFTLSSVEDIAVLEPEASATFEVTYAPVTLEHEGQIVITSNDERATRSIVELYGVGLIPAMYITPNPYDFGVVEPECPKPGDLTIENIGYDTLEVTNIAQVGANFVLEEGIELPFSLEPGELRRVELTFTPPSYEAYEGELWVGSNAGDQVVPETGEGGDAALYTDEWAQPISNKADIFFYVDQSCSMEDDQERLSNNFMQFTDTLEELDADFQVMVVTADSGCKNGPFITNQTNPNQIHQLFSDAVGGPSGHWTEAGLTIARNAVHPNQLSTCNQGFVREHSTVTFVLVSDEPEQSPSANPWPSAVAAILAQAPSSYIAAVVGPLPNGCDTAEPGTGYIEAATATGGIVRNICDYDWGTHLGQVAELATEVKLADTFYLRHEAQPDTVRVFVDDEEVFEGWRYNEENNTLVFETASVPGEGAEIVATYGSGFVCD